jgi:hypothetical protein
MAQHFLLSAAARSLSPGKVMRMSERGAENVFVRLRWPQTDGNRYVHAAAGAALMPTTPPRRSALRPAKDRLADTAGTCHGSRDVRGGGPIRRAAGSWPAAWPGAAAQSRPCSDLPPGWRFFESV